MYSNAEYLISGDLCQSITKLCSKLHWYIKSIIVKQDAIKIEQYYGIGIFQFKPISICQCVVSEALCTAFDEVW